jgi:hypothetical protein
MISFQNSSTRSVRGRHDDAAEVNELLSEIAADLPSTVHGLSYSSFHWLILALCCCAPGRSRGNPLVAILLFVNVVYTTSSDSSVA